MTIKEAIHIDPEILGGTPVFKGTRVALKPLFDYLESSSLEDFLEGFPNVQREQAEVVIESGRRIRGSYPRTIVSCDQPAERVLPYPRRNSPFYARGGPAHDSPQAWQAWT